VDYFLVEIYTIPEVGPVMIYALPDNISDFSIE